MQIERILNHSSVTALANDLRNCDEWLCFVRPVSGPGGLTPTPTIENVQCTSHPWRLIRSTEHDRPRRGDNEMILTIDDTNSVGTHLWTSGSGILDADQIAPPSANRVLECRLNPGRGLSAERCAAFGEHDRGFSPFVQELGFIAVVKPSKFQNYRAGETAMPLDRIDRVLDHSSLSAFMGDLYNYDKHRWFCFGQDDSEHSVHGAPWRLINFEYNQQRKEVDITIEYIQASGSIGSSRRTYHCRFLVGESGLMRRHQDADEQPDGWKRLGFVATLTTKPYPHPHPQYIPSDSVQVLCDALWCDDLPLMDEGGKAQVEFCFTNGDKRGPLWTLLSTSIDPLKNEHAYISIRLDGEAFGRCLTMVLRKGLLYPTPSCCNHHPAPFATVLGKSWATVGSRILRFPPQGEVTDANRDDDCGTTEIARMASSSISSIGNLVDALRPYFCGADAATQFRFVDEDGKKGRPWRVRLACLVGERLNLSIYPPKVRALLDIGLDSHFIELEMRLVDGRLHYARTLQGNIGSISTDGLSIIAFPFVGKGHLIVPEPAGNDEQVAKETAKDRTKCRRCGCTVKVEFVDKMGWCLDCEPDTLQGLIAAGQFAGASNLVDVLKPYVRGSGTAGPYHSLDKRWADFLKNYTVDDGVSRFHFFDKDGRRGCSWILMGIEPVKEEIANDTPLGSVWVERLINLRVCRVLADGQLNANWAAHTTELELKLDNDGLLYHKRTLKGASFGSDKPIIPSTMTRSVGLLIVPEDEDDTPDDKPDLITAVAKCEWKVQRILDHSSTQELARELRECEKADTQLGFVKAPNWWPRIPGGCPTVENAVVTATPRWTPSSISERDDDLVVTFTDAEGHHKCQWGVGAFGVVEDMRDGVNSHRAHLGFIVVLVKQLAPQEASCTTQVATAIETPKVPSAPHAAWWKSGALDHSSLEKLKTDLLDRHDKKEALYLVLGDDGSGPMVKIDCLGFGDGEVVFSTGGGWPSHAKITRCYVQNGVLYNTGQPARGDDLGCSTGRRVGYITSYRTANPAEATQITDIVGDKLSALDHSSPQALVDTVMWSNERFCFVNKDGKDGPAWRMLDMSVVKSETPKSDSQVVLRLLTESKTMCVPRGSTLNVQLIVVEGKLWYWCGNHIPSGFPNSSAYMVEPVSGGTTRRTEGVSQDTFKSLVAGSDVTRLLIKHLGSKPAIEELADAVYDECSCTNCQKTISVSGVWKSPLCPMCHSIAANSDQPSKPTHRLSYKDNQSRPKGDVIVTTAPVMEVDQRGFGDWLVTGTILERHPAHGGFVILSPPDSVTEQWGDTGYRVDGEGVLWFRGALAKLASLEPLETVDAHPRVTCTLCDKLLTEEDGRYMCCPCIKAEGKKQMEASGERHARWWSARFSTTPPPLPDKVGVGKLPPSPHGKKLPKPWPRSIKTLALLAVMVVAYNANCVIEHAKEHAPVVQSWLQWVTSGVECEVCGVRKNRVIPCSNCYGIVRAPMEDTKHLVELPLNGPPAEGGRSPVPVP